MTVVNKERIERLLDKIPTGRDSGDPLYVPNKDYGFRQAVAAKNNAGDLIVNNGDGYFRVDPKSNRDIRELIYYLKRERERADAITHKIDAMTETLLERLREEN